jgi:hypothetical protein
MKTVYITTAIEKRMDGSIAWHRVFPKKLSQIEMLSKNTLYWRGMGGGFALSVLEIGLHNVTLKKQTGKSIVTYRIQTIEYNRLLAKYSEQKRILDEFRQGDTP